MIVVVNQSKNVMPSELAAWSAAVDHQILNDVAPSWGRVYQPVRAMTQDQAIASMGPSDTLVVLQDNSDPDAADPNGTTLGDHTEIAGSVCGKVFVNACLAAGEEISRVLSHEVIEAFIDPSANLWARGPEGLYALEIADPVRASIYKINGVVVSDFVFPTWFDPTAIGPFAKISEIGNPFALASGGYCVRGDIGGNTEILGDKTRLDKPSLRAFRRCKISSPMKG